MIKAMDGKSQYFIKDATNRAYISSNLEGVLEERDIREARFAALGSTTTSYFILRMSGVMKWRDVLVGVDIILRTIQNNDLPPVEFVSLEGDKFFVRFSGGEWRIGGCSSKDEEFLNGVCGEAQQVYFVRDGVLARYNPKDAVVCEKDSGQKREIDHVLDSIGTENAPKRARKGSRVSCKCFFSLNTNTLLYLWLSVISLLASVVLGIK